ncbi:hypothetical protein C8J56DRAFT_788403 [Mycena floridula]|nr:hypothetical protein C8J56DRAFT_788403 [Mycena floridula]
MPQRQPVGERNGDKIKDREIFVKCRIRSNTTAFAIPTKVPVLVDITRPPGGTLNLFDLYVTLSRSAGRGTIQLLRSFNQDDFLDISGIKFITANFKVHCTGPSGEDSDESEGHVPGLAVMNADIHEYFA